MFGMSLPEIVIILVVILIVFGPERIPKIARTAGKLVREMRRAAAEVKQSIDIEDLRQELTLRNQQRQSEQKEREVSAPKKPSPAPDSTPTEASPGSEEAALQAYLEQRPAAALTRLHLPAPGESNAPALTLHPLMMPSATRAGALRCYPVPPARGEGTSESAEAPQRAGEADE